MFLLFVLLSLKGFQAIQVRLYESCNMRRYDITSNYAMLLTGMEYPTGHLQVVHGCAHEKILVKIGILYALLRESVA